MGPAFAPDGDLLAVCPHCWEVNVRAFRLCGRCGADMHMVLQESGGARRTAPVQSPVPIRAAARLTLLQRSVLFAVVLLIVFVQAMGALFASARHGGATPVRSPFVPVPVPTQPD